MSISTHRLYQYQGGPLAPYLLTLSHDLHTIYTWGGIGPDYPQCRAVVDDYGNLVIVTGWL